PSLLSPRLARLAPRHHRRRHHRGERGPAHLRQGRARFSLAAHAEADHPRLRGLLSAGASGAGGGTAPHGPRPALLSPDGLWQKLKAVAWNPEAAGLMGINIPPPGMGS